MHEIGLVDDILCAINSKLKESSTGTLIKKVNISIGELEHISSEHFEFHFRERTKGTKLENVKLTFRNTQTRFKCKKCFREFIPKGDNFSCPACGSKLADIIEGTGIFIESVELG